MAQNVSDSQPATVGPMAPPRQTPTALTPELVREVAEKVYAMLIHDLKIERERLRVNRPIGQLWRGGGR